MSCSPWTLPLVPRQNPEKTRKQSNVKRHNDPSFKQEHRFVDQGAILWAQGSQESMVSGESSPSLSFTSSASSTLSLEASPDETHDLNGSSSDSQAAACSQQITIVIPCFLLELPGLTLET